MQKCVQTTPRLTGTLIITESSPILSVLVLVSVNMPSEILKIKIRVRVYVPETRRYDGQMKDKRRRTIKTYSNPSNGLVSASSINNAVECFTQVNPDLRDRITLFTKKFKVIIYLWRTISSRSRGKYNNTCLVARKSQIMDWSNYSVKIIKLLINF